MDSSVETSTEAASPAELRLVFQGLSRLRQAIAQRGRNTPEVREQEKDLTARLAASAQLAGWLALELDEDTLYYEGQKVLSPSHTDAEVVRELSALGVRGLSIEGAVTASEVGRLVGLLGADWSQRAEFGQDLAAAIWAADMACIHLDLVEPLRSPRPAQRGLDELVARRDALFEGRPVGALVQLSRGVEARLSILREQLAGAAEPGAWHAVVSEAERDALAEEIQALQSPVDVTVEQVGQVLFELLRGLQEPDGEVLGRAVAAHCLELAERSDFPGAADLVRRSLVLTRSPDGDRRPTAVAFRRGMGLMLGELERSRLVAAIGHLSDPLWARPSLFTLLSQMPADRITDLARLCAELDLPELRQTVADALVVVVGENRHALIAAVGCPDEAEALAPLLALARITAPQAVGACLLRTRATDPRVREASLRALRTHEGPRVRDVVQEALRDEAEQVRIEALRYLTVYRDMQDLHHFEAQLTDPSFAQRSMDEARAWLLSYAMIGQQQALRLLKGALLGKQSVEHAQAKALLVRALLATGHPEGRKFVEQRSRVDEEVRSALRLLREEESRR